MTEQEAPRVAPQGVKEYLKAIETAEATLQAAEAALEVKYPGRYGYRNEALEERQLYRTERLPLLAAHTKARESAWQALKASSDPLVKWIAENCEGYEGTALFVLKALPATLDELDEVADEHDWCSTWDDFRNRAIEAGVISGAKPLPAAHRALLERIARESCCGLDAGARRRIGKALDELVKEAVQAAKQPETASV